MNYRQVVDHVKQRQRLAHRRMREPEDDWFPEAFFLQGEHLHQQLIPTRWFDDRASKEELVRGVFVPLIRTARVRVFAFSVVMYALTSEHPMSKLMQKRWEAGEESPTRGLPRFQDVKGSVEQLCVHAFDAERHEGWMAQITPSRARTTAPRAVRAGRRS